MHTDAGLCGKFFKKKEKAAPATRLWCINNFGCKYVYKKRRSTSQNPTLKPVNKPLTKFAEVTEGTVSGGT